MRIKLILFSFIGCFACQEESSELVLGVSSPNEEIKVNFNLDKEGKSFYLVHYKTDNQVRTTIAQQLALCGDLFAHTNGSLFGRGL